MVDVNVHPAKTVVKFVSDKSVFDAFYYTVRDALDGENKPEAPAPKQESFYRSMTVQQYKETAVPAVEIKKPLGSYVARPTETAAPVGTVHPAIAADKSAVTAVHDVAPEKDKPFTATLPTVSGRQVTYHITPPAAQESPKEQPAAELPDRKAHV